MKNNISLLVILLVLVAVGWMLFQNDALPAFSSNPPQDEVVPEPVANCYVGGCSGQICSDEEGAVSTCEFREEYACYRTAKCERQSNGQCGWTQTEELNMCLQGSL